MKLTRLQFDLLTCILQEGRQPAQRVLARLTGWSLGSVNRVLGEMKDLGWLAEGHISPQGLMALEPYRVKRAVVLAAGFGARMVPITLSTPKPLIRIRGVRIIDTLLDAVTEAGIREIVLVRGYLADQFDQLLEKYPTIRFLDNPDYKETNNISSLLRARDFLRSAYILEADLFLMKPGLISPYQYRTNYLGVPVDRTDDWCFSSKEGRITALSQGGSHCHHMFGISYWSDEDGERLADRVGFVYDLPGGKERFWDSVALDYYSRDFDIEIRPCSFDDLVELDTYRELCQLDPAYGNL
ncbi:MAG: NTP transferase domain-containing protein [Saccharofermentanales bacterium]